MSNSGSLNNGTNGRQSANKTSSSSSSSSSMTATSMSIIHKHKDAHDGNVLPLITNSKSSSTVACTVGGTTPLSTANTTSTTTTRTLPTKSNNNENISSHLVNSHNNASSATSTGKITPTTKSAINVIQTHRRDNSYLSGQRDARKYKFIRPQYKELNIKTVSTTSSTSSPTKSSPTCSIMPSFHNEKNNFNSDDSDNRDMSLVYYENDLVSASLEALILHMVPTHEYYPDQSFIFSFILSARLFIRPHELLARISKTWEQQQKNQQLGESGSEDVVDEAHVRDRHIVGINVPTSASPLTQRKAPYNDIASITAPIQKPARTATQKSAQNCIRLLSDWIETFPYDFRDERLMQQVRILARKCVYIDNALGKQVSRILQLLVLRLTALEKYEEFLQSLLAADLSHNSSIAGSNLLQHYSTSASAAYHAMLTNSSSVTSSSSANLDSQHKSLHFNTPAGSSLACGTGSNTHSSSTHSDSNEVFGIMDLCPSCAQLAHQLTAIELERLSHIGPEEFVQAFAKEYSQNISNNSNSSQNNSGNGTNNAAGISGNYSVSNSNPSNSMSSSLNDMKKTRNLESYVEWFNRLSYLTASEIVKYPKKKQRVRVIEYWIETARECFNIGNFNSLMAIIAGLNLAPISRLKKTWSKVQSAKFSVLEHQMDPTSNFNSYRSTLKAAMWRSEGATEERERIIIPFFSLFVKDLYFLNEGCSNRLPNNHINFEKCSQLAKQVMEFNEWKKVQCPFEKLPNVIQYLQTCPILNENTLSMASFECEPPENTEEKGRYKTVKAETKMQLLQQLQEQQLQQPH